VDPGSTSSCPSSRWSPVRERGAFQLEGFAQDLVDLGLVVDRIHVADLEIRDEAAIIRGDGHLRHGDRSSWDRALALSRHHAMAPR
jgi:hypothetical protein